MRRVQPLGQVPRSPRHGRDLGAEALATGHYVASRPAPGGGRALYRALDPARDQSYFLYATTPEQLAFLRFPSASGPRTRPRALARDWD